jgi:hypothetical protein
VSVLFRNFARFASAAAVVGGAVAYAVVGVDTLIVGATGHDPAGWLETTFGPTIDRIHDLGR